MQIVWFKRDLRITDHVPFVEAARVGPVLALYVYEEELLRAGDADARHLGFLNEALDDLQAALNVIGLKLYRLRGAMPQVLDDIRRQARIDALWSHEETGNGASYARDRAVAAWCRAHGVPWHERQNGAVVRRLRDRDEWSARWLDAFRAPPLQVPSRITPATLPIRSLTNPPTAELLDLPSRDIAGRQTAGRKQAQRELDTFLEQRVVRYRTGMSSPLSAGDDCSRLSPHLAFGVMSLREVVHDVWRVRSAWMAGPAGAHRSAALAGLKSFESRLHWHCHFIQKLESQPDIEFRPVNRLYEGLREPDFSLERHLAWCRGETGYPLIDACMRALNATGWINFRMRAMLVSFSSYQLWNHWREPSLHLARMFTDYEPGIHYPQVQMQSGVTGINTLRIYNPVKQQIDQDPKGIFVRRWLPELSRVPLQWLAEPWRMSPAVQQQAGCVIGRDYPAPVVDHLLAARAARDAIWAIRRMPEAVAESRRVFLLHGSRHPRRESSMRRRKVKEDDAQTGFDF